MSICYVFGPAHQEIKKVLHIWSHYVQKPSYVISHSGHDHKIIVGNKRHQNRIKVQPHSHKFIDLFADILKRSGLEKDPVDTKSIILKIDKHIKNIKTNSKDKFVVFLNELRSNFPFKKEKPCKGFIKYLKEPPRLV